MQLPSDFPPVSAALTLTCRQYYSPGQASHPSALLLLPSVANMYCCTTSTPLPADRQRGRGWRAGQVWRVQIRFNLWAHRRQRPGGAAAAVFGGVCGGGFCVHQ